MKMAGPPASQCRGRTRASAGADTAGVRTDVGDALDSGADRESARGRLPGDDSVRISHEAIYAAVDADSAAEAERARGRLRGRYPMIGASWSEACRSPAGSSSRLST